MTTTAPPTLRCPCGGDRTTAHVYTAPPAGETRFEFGGTYRRELQQCTRCGHYLSIQSLVPDSFYEGAYVNATYGGQGLRDAYERILRLEPAASDNAGRVRRITAHFDRDGPSGRAVLDVGSGLGVFAHAMREAGWQCTALDPDPRAAEHARHIVGVPALCADFMTADAPGTFDLVTLNKVLEHVPDPYTMLARCHGCLTPDGIVYVELPDAGMAMREGPERQEFHVEHLHGFSVVSLVMMAAGAGFDVQRLQRLRDPSGKYTMFAFLSRGVPC